MAKLKAQVDSLAREKASADSVIEELRSREQSLQGELTTLKKEVSQLRKVQGSSSEKLQSSEQLAETLSAELEKVKGERSRLKKESGELQQALKQQQEELEQLKAVRTPANCLSSRRNSCMILFQAHAAEVKQAQESAHKMVDKAQQEAKKELDAAVGALKSKLAEARAKEQAALAEAASAAAVSNANNNSGKERRSSSSSIPKPVAADASFLRSTTSSRRKSIAAAEEGCAANTVTEAPREKRSAGDVLQSPAAGGLSKRARHDVGPSPAASATASATKHVSDETDMDCGASDMSCETPGSEAGSTRDLLVDSAQHRPSTPTQGPAAPVHREEGQTEVRARLSFSPMRRRESEEEEAVSGTQPGATAPSTPTAKGSRPAEYTLPYTPAGAIKTALEKDEVVGVTAHGAPLIGSYARARKYGQPSPRPSGILRRSRFASPGIPTRKKPPLPTREPSKKERKAVSFLSRKLESVSLSTAPSGDAESVLNDSSNRISWRVPTPRKPNSKSRLSDSEDADMEDRGDSSSEQQDENSMLPPKHRGIEGASVLPLSEDPFAAAFAVSGRSSSAGRVGSRLSNPARKRNSKILG